MTGSAAGAGRLARVWSRVCFSYQAYRQAARINRESGLDIIIAPELFGQGFFASLFMKRKLVTRIHAPTALVDDYNERHSFSLIRHLLSLPEKIQAKRSLAMTVATNFLSTRISAMWKISPDRIEILRDGVDVTWIRDIAAAREREVQGAYLLYFGRLEKLKGVGVLSGVLRQILEQQPDLNMVFIGRDWGCKENILRENEKHLERILIYDTMEKERLFPFVRHAEMVVLPSLFENFSNAGLEAMALERPVLATYNTGFSELIKDGINGFLVEPGNQKALGRKILDCLQRDDLQAIGRHAYETVLEFDLLKTGRQNIEFFREKLKTQRH